MSKPRVVIYPLLAATYPVLALAAANPGEIPGLWVLTRPLAISLIVCVCAWLIFGALVRDPDRRAFLAFIVIVLFAAPGYFTIGGDNGAVLPILGLVGYLAATTYLVFRLVRKPRDLTRFLTILTSILVVWSTIDLARQTAWWQGPSGVSGELSKVPAPIQQPDKGGPDIYLIVLDKYTGGQSLRSNFGFDNGEFERFLVERGFAVPRSAQANYITTQLSLASLVNSRYLDELSAKPGTENREKAYVNRLVEDSAVWRFLKAHNYRFIFFPTAFPVTGNNRLADIQLPNPRGILTEFEIVWRRTTLAYPVISWICQRIRCARAVSPFTAEIPEQLEWKFEQLSRLPQWPREGRPLFVFAHLTIPHEPYVFNADCSLRPPLWPSYSLDLDQTPERQAYVAQITCLNRKLERVVGHLLDDSPKPPVILLQGDHGHGQMPLHIPDVDSLTPTQIAERANVFAAYYLPGADTGVVYDSITPVNVFRTVFRHYFHANLAPLPDKTYWSPWTAPFKFTRVNRGYRSPE
jgi:hypothetical protein